MSFFRLIKYSTLLLFLGKYKFKLFRALAVLLFAAVTALLYGDVEAYLAREHPSTVIYALTAKICIVYGALLFVLWQFRPGGTGGGSTAPSLGGQPRASGSVGSEGETADRLSQYADLDRHERLQSRAEALLKKK